MTTRMEENNTGYHLDETFDPSFDTTTFSPVNFDNSLTNDLLTSARTTNSTNLFSTVLFPSNTASEDQVLGSSQLSFATLEDDNLETTMLADLNTCEGGYQTTELRNNSWYIIFYVFWSKFLLVEIIPWVSVIVLTVLTSRKIKQFQANRHRLLGSNRNTGATGGGSNDEGNNAV